MKNKLLVCFRPVEAEDELSVSVNSTTTCRSSLLRKSKSLIIKSNTKLVDDDSNKIKRKETNRSISGSFAHGLSLQRSSSKGDGEVVPTIDLRNASKRNRFSLEDKCWDQRLDGNCMNMRMKQSLSEASLKLPSSSSFDHEELERGFIQKKKIMGIGAESRSSPRWAVYLILVISLLTTVFYGRVCSVLVTSSSCLFLCFPRWKGKTSLSIRSNCNSRL